MSIGVSNPNRNIDSSMLLEVRRMIHCFDRRFNSCIPREYGRWTSILKDKNRSAWMKGRPRTTRARFPRPSSYRLRWWNARECSAWTWPRPIRPTPTRTSTTATPTHSIMQSWRKYWPFQKMARSSWINTVFKDTRIMTLWDRATHSWRRWRWRRRTRLAASHSKMSTTTFTSSTRGPNR